MEKDLKAGNRYSVYPVNMNPCACFQQLYTSIWCIGTTAGLAMRRSYRKQHTASCAGHGLRPPTLHKGTHRDRPSGGKSIVCLRWELFFWRSDVLLIRPSFGRRYRRQQPEGREGQPRSPGLLLQPAGCAFSDGVWLLFSCAILFLRSPGESWLRRRLVKWGFDL